MLTIHSVESSIEELRKSDPYRIPKAIDEAKELYKKGVSALDGYRKSRYMKLTDQDVNFLREKVTSVLEEFAKSQSLQHCCFCVGDVDDFEDLYEQDPEFEIDCLYENPDVIDYVYWILSGEGLELHGILKDGRSFFAFPNSPRLRRIK